VSGTSVLQPPWRKAAAAIPGLLLLAWLLGHYASAALSDALRGSTAMIGAIVLTHGVVVGVDASAWWWLVRTEPEARGAHWRFLLWAAFVRDAVGNLLPLSRLAGDVVGVRLFLSRSPSATLAVAGVAAEVATHAITQAVYWDIGLLEALRHTGLAAAAPLAAVAIGVVMQGTAVFGIALLGGVPLNLLGRLLAALGRRRAAILRRGIGRTRIRLSALTRSSAQIATVCALQLCALALSTLESWLILRGLGHPVSADTAVVLESLTQAVRSVLSFVPAGLGVQELALVLGAGAYGIPAPVGMAASLLKRARELVLGLPFLLWWQCWEWRNATRPA
jgi:putative membrane protein